MDTAPRASAKEVQAQRARDAQSLPIYNLTVNSMPRRLVVCRANILYIGRASWLVCI